MNTVYVAGVGSTPFGKFLDRNLKDLADEAVTYALKDAGASAVDIQSAYVGNAAAGILTGQEMIRGQVALRPLGFHLLPIFNIENACASGSTAFHLAWQAVATGAADIVLAVGLEKLTHEDKLRSFAAIGAAVDVDARERMQEAMSDGWGGPSDNRSFFVDIYASMARDLLNRGDVTTEDLAKVAVKAHLHASLNPKAQYRNVVSVEDVLQGRSIVDPLTLLMCAPIGDGAAAAVLASEDGLRRLSGARDRAVRVAASVVMSGALPDALEKSTKLAAQRAYDIAGIGPNDLDCLEVHDAAAPAELTAYESLGLAEEGGAARLLTDGSTTLGGRHPVNVSGGLLCKGHPIGATGLGQIDEVVTQLRGEAGPRQVESARVALTQNGGGWIDDDSAAVSVHIFTHR